MYRKDQEGKKKEQDKEKLAAIFRSGDRETAQKDAEASKQGNSMETDSESSGGESTPKEGKTGEAQKKEAQEAEDPGTEEQETEKQEQDQSEDQKGDLPKDQSEDQSNDLPEEKLKGSAMQTKAVENSQNTEDGGDTDAHITTADDEPELIEDDIRQRNTDQKGIIPVISGRELEYYKYQYDKGMGMAIQEMVSLFSSLCRYQQEQILSQQKIYEQIRAEKDQASAAALSAQMVEKYIEDRILSYQKNHDKQTEEVMSAIKEISSRINTLEKTEDRGEADTAAHPDKHEPDRDEQKEKEREKEGHSIDSAETAPEKPGRNGSADEPPSHAEDSGKEERDKKKQPEIHAAQGTEQTAAVKEKEEKENSTSVDTIGRKKEEIRAEKKPVIRAEPKNRIGQEIPAELSAEHKGIFSAIRSAFRNRSEKRKREKEKEQIQAIREALFNGKYSEDQARVISKAVNSGIELDELEKICDPSVDAAMMEIYLGLIMMRKGIRENGAASSEENVDKEGRADERADRADRTGEGNTEQTESADAKTEAEQKS